MATQLSPQKQTSLYLIALARAISGSSGPDWRSMPVKERHLYVIAARRVMKVQKKWAAQSAMV
jgi:hypothetical protein